MITYVPVSIGELLDKLSILEIKTKKITDLNKLKNVIIEYTTLKTISDELKLSNDVLDLYTKLCDINNELWDIEVAKRRCEKYQKFDDEFIQLARNVYIKNDNRADIKKLINILSDSYIVEEKQHT